MNLRDLQLTQLEILLEFNRICKKMVRSLINLLRGNLNFHKGIFIDIFPPEEERFPHHLE